VGRAARRIGARGPHVSGSVPTAGIANSVQCEHGGWPRSWHNAATRTAARKAPPSRSARRRTSV
jgi:hypothetical protein